MGRFWFAAVALTVGVCCGADFLIFERLVVGWDAYPNDFATFWTAGRAPWDAVYDVKALTALQAWARFDAGAPRPFPYPPTLLFVLNPLGQLDRLPAFILWTAAGLGAYAVAARGLVGKGWWLALASPAVMEAVVSGQVSLFVSALMMAGVVCLPRRPVLAGLAFGVLATVKPQAALLVPIALMVAGCWRALLAALGAGALVGLASVAWHGKLWFEWLAGLGEFSRIIAAQPWAPILGVTPSSLTKVLGLEATPFAYLLPALGVALALALVGLAFRRDEPVLRYGALATGYLLASPYALWYELALLQPLAVWWLLRRGWAGRGAGLLAYTLYARWFAVIATGLALLHRSARPAREEA